VPSDLLFYYCFFIFEFFSKGIVWLVDKYAVICTSITFTCNKDKLTAA
jgi:hypothetical protein